MSIVQFMTEIGIENKSVLASDFGQTEHSFKLLFA